MPSGGPLTDITCNHPTLGSFIFDAVAGEDSTYNPGGVRSVDDDAMVTGTGQEIDQKSITRWSMECTLAGDMNTAKTMEALVSLAASPLPGNWTFTNSNGAVYAGSGRPVGEIKQNGQNTNLPLKVSGGGTLSQL